MNLKEKFRHVLNFPKEGIDFIDITTVLQDKDAFKYAIDSLVNLVKDLDFELIVGPESRGFIFGAPVAYVLNKGLVLVRKKVNFLTKQSLLNMSLNMEKMYLRCTLML